MSIMSHGRGREQEKPDGGAMLERDLPPSRELPKQRPMAVYTEVSDEELLSFVDAYDIGEVLACKGIAEGVENSNYQLTTDDGSFILTLYEKRVRPEDLPFFLGLMDHLAARGLPCPIPVAARNGETLHHLCGRPAAIVTFLPGMWPKRPTAEHCTELGATLAAFHSAGADYPAQRPNDLSVAAWRPLLERSEPRAAEVKQGLAESLNAELYVLEADWPSALPSGVIHADLFPDNVFFRHGQVSGVIDFYFACTDFFAYDIAICLNAWCFEPDLSFNVTKARRLLQGYQRVRKLGSDELDALPLLARGAAMRFLVTRLYDWLHTPSDALVTPKDPMEYAAKLRFHAGVNSIGAYGLE